MNAQPPSPHQPLNSNHPSDGTLRIRRISRYLKAMVLFYFVVVPAYVICCMLLLKRGGGWDISPAWSVLSIGEKLMSLLSTVIYLCIAVTFYRLLNLFEKGTFFSPASVRLLRILGYLAFTNGLLGVITPVMASGMVAFPTILLAAIGSPWVTGGLFAIMISHIMDEGCKLREDQDLTV